MIMNRTLRESRPLQIRSGIAIRALLPVCFLVTGSLAFAAPESAQTIYHDSCSLCHSAEHAGDNSTHAPLVGDQAAWAPRIAKGRRALYSAAINGVPKSDMPGRGDYEGTYSEEEMRAVVDYMIRGSTVTVSRSKRSGRWVAADVRE